jgi:hypothetical protein
MRDPELLKEYLHGGSEDAFAELVNRYVGLAYSVARRKLQDSSLAEEVGPSALPVRKRAAVCQPTN